MKFYKGLKRLFNTVDLESEESDSQHRYIVVPGITNMDELRYSVIPIFSNYDGVPLGENSGELVETTFIIKNENDEILKEEILSLPIYWVKNRQIYNLFIDYSHEIIPFGANLESKELLSNIDTGTGTGFINLPASILSINDTYSQAQISEAFGGIDNINIFKDAVINKKPILFYSDYSEESVLNGQIYNTKYTYDTTSICVYQRYRHAQNSYIYTKESGTDSIANLYDGYKITVVNTNSDFITDLNIVNLVFGFTSANHDNLVFTKAIRTHISLNSKLSEYVGLLQEDVDSLKKSATDQVPVGSGMDFWGQTPPENYMFADGRELSRTEYSDLFNVIGTMYGPGDGSTTFNLPDKRRRVSVMYESEDEGFATLGNKLGSIYHTLTADNLPKTVDIDIPVMTTESKYGGVHSDSRVYEGNIVVSTGGESDASFKITSLGNGTSISNLQPSIVCNYIIKVKYGSSISAILEGEY